MNARALRRLATDQHALRTQPLPPHYLFPSSSSAHSDDLTSLDILLAGPAHTPFAAGVWKLHLTIPPTYPQSPPTAHFRTPIFHPNVDPATGAVCVETLKRDWDARLTLRDVLVTISCLLIQPNPDSALNAEAGALLQEGFAAFARRAEMLADIQAKVPRNLLMAVQEAQKRGEISEEHDATDHDEPDSEEVPIRRRRTIARVREQARRAESPGASSTIPWRESEPDGRMRQPFVFGAREDDVFGSEETRDPTKLTRASGDENSSIVEADQENDILLSPAKVTTPKLAATPRRPHGQAIPLGELILDEQDDDDGFDTSEDMEPEYPPSPRKSPSKSPRKPNPAYPMPAQQPESSRHAALRALNITPPNDDDKPLAEGSLFAPSASASPSPRKSRNGLFRTPMQQDSTLSRNLFGKTMVKDHAFSGVHKARSPSSSDHKRDERQRQASLNAKLWQLCGQDIVRWNAGDFDGEPFPMKAARW